MKWKLLLQNFASSSLLPLGTKQVQDSESSQLSDTNQNLTWRHCSLSPSFTSPHCESPTRDLLFWTLQPGLQDWTGNHTWGCRVNGRCWAELCKQNQVSQTWRPQSCLMQLIKPQVQHCTAVHYVWCLVLIRHWALEPQSMLTEQRGQNGHEEKEAESHVQTNRT